MDITAALTTITSAAELARLIISGKIDDEVKAKATELNNSILSLQGTIFSLQSQNHELLKTKHDLENQLIKIADWQKEAQRYYLYELCSGVMVYALKEDQSNSEPFHYVCPNCYQNKRKSFLQKRQRTYAGCDYVCANPECNAVFTNYQDREPLNF
jgi:hypothetical protein